MERVEAILRDEDDDVILPATNLTEVIDVLVRGHGNDLEEVRERLDWLMVSSLRVLAIDRSLAILAGELRALHYHRERRPLSLADCTALAASLSLGEALATADAPLAKTARELGVRVEGLSNTRGHMP